jgi:hypothetical protein
MGGIQLPCQPGLLVAEPCQRLRGTSAHEQTDEVCDERDDPDNAGIVVTRTVPKRLRSVADGDRPDNGDDRQNGPVANDEAEGQAEEKPGEAENDARPNQLHGI